MNFIRSRSDVGNGASPFSACFQPNHFSLFLFQRFALSWVYFEIGSEAPRVPTDADVKAIFHFLFVEK